MQPARRVALAALVAVLSGLVLPACRTEPTVAVYVDSHRYTEKSVDRIVKTGQGNPAGLTASREWVVELLVARDIGEKLVAEQNVTVQHTDTGPAAAEYLKLWATVYDIEQALLQTAKQPHLTDADLTGFYRAGVAAGLYPAGATQDQVRAGLNNPGVASVIGLRAMFSDAAAHHVTVNPRYAPLALPYLHIDPQGHGYQLAVPFPPDTATGVRDSAA
jgi:hypothetical protein